MFKQLIFFVFVVMLIVTVAQGYKDYVTEKEWRRKIIELQLGICITNHKPGYVDWEQRQVRCD